MKKKKTSCISLITTLIISMAMLGAKIGAQSLPLIYVDPPTYTATTLSEFTIDINIANVSNLQIVEFKLGYNTTILDATNVTQGPFMKIGYNVMVAVINDSLGYVDVAIGIISGGPAQGSGTLATITFNSTYYGSASCALDLYDTFLYDPEIQPIDHEVADGYYEFIVLDLTVAMGKLVYDRNETIDVHGTLSIKGSPVDGLVALEAKDPSVKSLIFRTIKTGTNPPVGNITITDFYPCDSLGNPKNSFYKGTLARFRAVVHNNGTVSKKVKITVNTYDVKTSTFGVAAIELSILPNSTSYFQPSIPIPDWVSVGTGKAYASAFTDFPSLGGAAYCPEESATYEIVGVGGGGGAATLGAPEQNNNFFILTETLGSYNLTFKLPDAAESGAYRVYAGSSYQGLNATSRTFFGVEALFVPSLFPTIQEAVDAATPEYNTIFVASGTYYEHVTINKTVILIGQDPSNTIIDGNETGTVVYINADNVEITGFTMQNSGNSSPNSGIALNGSSGIIISENIVSNNEYGIHINRSTDITLRDNTIASNIYNFGVEGDSLQDFIHDIDTTNTVDGKPIYYWMNQKNKQIPSNAGYIAVVNSENIIVKALTLTKNTQGVLFAFTSNSLIERVNAQDNKYGIYLVHSDDNTIIGSTVQNNDVGIYLINSNQNIICHQGFINNTDQVQLHQSSNTWEDGVGKGNYWSDYAGEDLNGDGVGDTLLPHQGVDYYPLMTPWILIHDIAVTSIRTIPYRYIPTYNVSRIYPGWVINVNVTLKNEGDFSETFTVTAYFYNGTYTEAGPPKTVTNLTPLKEKTITVTCTTTGATPLLNYTIKAMAAVVSGETDTADNTKVNGTVKIGWVGDANDDGHIALKDLSALAKSYRRDLEDPAYNPQCDFDGDGEVALTDLSVLAKNYRKGPLD